jgi:nicotinamidase-related amidase
MDAYTEPDFDRCALITVDVQCDVLDGAPMEVPGTTAILPAIGTLLSAFRSTGRPIVHLVRLYQRDGTDVDLCRREEVKNGAPLLLAGSPGAELVPGLVPGPATKLDPDLLLTGLPQAIGTNEVILFKPRWGGFYRTSLAEHLRMLEVTTLVFCGANFPNCPRTSLYEASERDFRLVLVTDAVSAFTGDGRAELAAISVGLLTSDSVAASLG